MTAGSEKLDPLVEHYLSASRAENTRRAYESDLRGFRKWGGTIPADTAAVVRYVAHHAGTFKPSTLRRHLAAIASAHRDLECADPTKVPIVARVMHGIERSHGAKPTQVAPLMLNDLSRIVVGIGHSRRDLRDKTILLLGFFGALRRSEIVGLDCESLRFDDLGVTISVRRSKTDQTALGRTVRLQKRKDALCPIQALRTHIDCVGGNGLVFSSSGRRLTDRTVARIVKRHVAGIGLDPERYGGHSLRAGYATSAALSGHDALMISRQTGHRTMQALNAYVRPANSIDLQLSPAVGSGRDEFGIPGHEIERAFNR